MVSKLAIEVFIDWDYDNLVTVKNVAKHDFNRRV